VNPACDIVIKLVRHYLEDAGVQVLPEDIAAGPARTLRFRPAMGGCIRTPECGAAHETLTRSSATA